MSIAIKAWSAVAVVALAGIAVVSYDQAHNSAHAAAANPHAGVQMAAAPKDAPINACALLKDSEVAEVAGAEVVAGERRDDGEVGDGTRAPVGTYSSTCFWRFKADVDKTPDRSLPMGGMRFVILQAMAWPTPDDAKRFIDGFQEAFEHQIIPAAPIAVEGLGQQAVWWGDGTAVRQNSTSVGVSVFLQDPVKKPIQRTMEETLAKKIIPRVKK